MPDIAIRVDNLSKRYRIGLKNEIHDTFAGAVTSFIRSPVQNLRRLRRLTSFDEKNSKSEIRNSNSDDIIWALKDVSFEIQRGEVVGIIGRNGAGKSTLLKILSRITEPTSGRAEIYGRVSSLLEVGTGFHPELTGRENLYLNGTILGMRKAEIDRKFDEIVDFSGVEKFIDTPVKRYSSGMRVRLAFSVAAHLEPEILLVDEVLAVGDASFQKKSLGKMDEISKGGRTVLFVSHNMGMINSLCENAILLHMGQIASHGNATEIVQKYLRSFDNSNNEQQGKVVFPEERNLPFQVNSIRSVGRSGETKVIFDIFESITIELDYVIREAIKGSHLSLSVLQHKEKLINTWDTDTVPDRFHNRKQGHYRARITLPCPLLKAVRYEIKPAMGILSKITTMIQGLPAYCLQ